MLVMGWFQDNNYYISIHYFYNNELINLSKIKINKFRQNNNKSKLYRNIIKLNQNKKMKK